MNLAALLLAGCRETPAESAPVPFCDSGPALVYEPSPETLFTTWPDDYWRVPTSDTPTGWRLGVGTDEYPATAEFAENFVENFDHATTLDGFGTTTPVAFQFAGDVSGLVTTGNATVADMQSNCTFVRITGAGLRESHVHDIAITREAPNYRQES